LLGAEFDITENGEEYILKDSSNAKYAKIGDLSKGAGTYYPCAYKIDQSLTVVDTAGYLDESMDTLIRISSHMLLDLIVRTGNIKIVLVLPYDSIGKLNELIYKEMKILKQIVNRADVDILLAVNRYPGNRRFFSMSDQEKVSFVNKQIYDKGDNVIKGLEDQICNAIKGPLEKYEKSKGLITQVKTFVNQTVSKIEDLIQRFNKLLEDENIKKLLKNDPPFKESEKKIQIMSFIYHFFKYNIQQRRNFQYFDVFNTPSIEMLKSKMISLNHVQRQNLVFYGNSSPVLYKFQTYMDEIHYKNILPFFKRFIFRKIYPEILENLKKLINDLNKYLKEHPIVDNSKEIDILTQDNKNIENEITNIETEKANLLKQEKEIFRVIPFENHDRFYPECLVAEKTQFPIIDYVEELDKDTERVELYSSSGNLFKAKYKSYGFFNWTLGIFGKNSPCKGKITLYSESKIIHAAELRHLDSQIALKRRLISENEERIDQLKKDLSASEISKQKQADLSLLNQILADVENTENPYDDFQNERDQYLLKIFTDVSYNLYGNVAVFKRYLVKSQIQPTIVLDLNDVSSLRKLKNNYYDLFFDQTQTQVH